MNFDGLSVKSIHEGRQDAVIEEITRCEAGIAGSIVDTASAIVSGTAKAAWGLISFPDVAVGYISGRDEYVGARNSWSGYSGYGTWYDNPATRAVYFGMGSVVSVADALTGHLQNFLFNNYIFDPLGMHCPWMSPAPTNLEGMIVEVELASLMFVTPLILRSARVARPSKGANVENLKIVAEKTDSVVPPSPEPFVEPSMVEPPAITRKGYSALNMEGQGVFEQLFLSQLKRETGFDYSYAYDPGKLDAGLLVQHLKFGSEYWQTQSARLLIEILEKDVCSVVFTNGSLQELIVWARPFVDGVRSPTANLAQEVLKAVARRDKTVFTQADRLLLTRTGNAEILFIVNNSIPEAGFIHQLHVSIP